MESPGHFRPSRNVGKPMRGRLASIAATFACTAAIAFSLLVAPLPAQAATPENWSNECDVPGLALAPVISADKNNDGTPVRLRPGSNGKYVPVIYVHGWTSTSIHEEGGKGAFSAKPDLLTSRIGNASPNRTLIGNIQELGGTAAFTFDYARYASRWVTDDNIGPSLGNALDCLADKSGEKVIVVAHSMGGLATRQALELGGASLAAKVSQVITFGTPNTGSLVAAVLAAGIDSAAAASLLRGDPLGPTLRLILSYCGKAMGEDQFSAGHICSAFPPLGSFDSPGGAALRMGSGEMKALPAWPEGVTVHSLAGGTNLISTTGFFLQRKKTTAAAGDVIVGVDSAQSGATTTKVAQCSYELTPTTSIVDGARVNILRTATLNEVSRSAWVNFFYEKNPCFHTLLMRNAELALAELGFIVDDVQSRQPATKFVTHRPWLDGSEKSSTQVIDGQMNADNYCEGSNVTNRADAFRCFVNGIYDPCLRNPSDRTEYLCITGENKVLITNVRPSNSRSSFTKSPDESNPYLLTLADGTTCRMSSGAGPPSIPGYPYWAGSCKGPHAGIWRARIRDRGESPTAGLLDKSASGVWHVAIEEDAAPGKATLYPVEVAYR